MDKAIEGADAVRRVKRGRKPMVKADIGVVCPEGYVADGDYYKPEAVNDAPVYAEVPYGDGSTGRKFYTPAQILALRIWEGQSPDVPVIERVARIANGLKAQGFGVDVTLPHPDAERYMKAHL